MNFQFPNIKMYAKGQRIVFLLVLTVIFSVGVHGQDPHDYFGQDEVNYDYYDDDSIGAQEDDTTVINDDENDNIYSDSSSTSANNNDFSNKNNELNPEKLIQNIEVSHSNVTIIDNFDLKTRLDARGSNLSITPMTSLDLELDLENTTAIYKPHLNLSDLSKAIENGINALDVKLTPWIVEDMDNPQDPGNMFNDRLRGLQNGMDAMVDILTDIAGKLGCEKAGLCSAPFKKVRSGECLYLNLESRKTWLAAREYCQLLGADLAEPVSIQQDLEYILRLSGTAMIGMDRDRLWVGASDQDKEGVWRWGSGSLVAQDIGWTNNHPRDITGKEDCMAMIFKHPPGVEALSCLTRNYFVCQKHI